VKAIRAQQNLKSAPYTVPQFRTPETHPETILTKDELTVKITNLKNVNYKLCQYTNCQKRISRCMMGRSYF
jgi:hypothetical protein